MVRNFILRVFLYAGISLFASGQSEIYRNSELIKASVTIAPSKMLNREDANIYLHGFLEYFPQSSFSFRGESYFFVDTQNKENISSPFVHNAMRTYFGVFLHSGKGNFSPYIGLQPGIVLMRPAKAFGPDLRLCPSFALHVGANYFVWKYFHFFLDIAYVNSTYRGLVNGSQKTDEMILAAGLGFQLPSLRKSL